MEGDGETRPIEPGYANRDVTKVPGWHGLVAWDMLFNNLTTGLFLFAAVAELASPRVFRPVSMAAYPIALAFLLVDLMLLVADLGDPLRFHHMLRVFKPSSPMSLGTWSLTVYSLPLTLIVAIEAAGVLQLLPAWSNALEAVRRSAVVLGLLPAFGSVAYKGVLFSTCSQPGWKDSRWLGGFMANSALLLGCVQMLAVSVLIGQERAAATLRDVALVLLPLGLIPTTLVFLDIRGTLARIYGEGQVYRTLAGILVGGTLLPLVLLLFGGRPGSLAASAFVILGGLAARARYIKIPHASHHVRSGGGG